jgi:acetoin:2,6-dichlorophenolindophenol oxidoreductase subunit beta
MAGLKAGDPVQTTTLQAMNKALRDALAEDEAVFVMGEDIQAGTFGLTQGLVAEFGEERVRNTPISEGAIVGAAVGAAMCGLKPVVDLSIATFAYVALDQLVNQAAKNRYLFGAQANVPATFHFVTYHRSNSAAQHTDRPHPLFMGIPGFKVVAPATPNDGYGLMRAAIRDPDPVIVLTDMTTVRRRGVLDERAADARIGKAAVSRAGTDVTLVAFFSLYPALAVAERLAAEGISVEVIDPLTLAPLDVATILASVRKTGRLVAVDIAYEACSAASEVLATVTESAFGALRAAPRRVCTPMVHIPFCPPLEKQMFPDEARIESAVRQVVAEGRT